MPIYLDHAATSPMTPSVIAAYASALGIVGNPSSIHSQGQNAKRVLEEAREKVAASLGADAVEVTFTGGGTESVNLAIKGLYWASSRSTAANRVQSTPQKAALPALAAGGSATAANRVQSTTERTRLAAVGTTGRRRIIVPRGEHHATIDAVEWLEQQGAIATWVDIDERGRIDLDALEAACGPDVALITAIYANNEVGTVQDVAAIAAIGARHGVPVHLDAVAAYGYLPIDFHALGVAALSVSAHKIGGPVGVGALLIARTASVEPLLHGGNQQRARSGTQDAAGAVAFGVAAEEASARLADHAAHLRTVRDRLVEGIRAAVPTAVYRGDPVDRLPGNAHFTFPGCEGDSLLFLLDVAGFSVSTGSACQAGVPEASHVLLAMGLSGQDARGALRFTLGPDTTTSEVDALVAALPGVVARASDAGLAERVPTLGR